MAFSRINHGCREKSVCDHIKVVTAGVVILLIILNLLFSRWGLTTTYYTIPSGKLDSEIRVVHLTDLHGAVFGSENSRLLKSVKDACPDVIFFTGDLIDSHKETEISETEELIRKLTAIAPVYISLGNQDVERSNLSSENLVDIYQASGATVLEKQYLDCEINGQCVRIGGIFGYCQPVAYAMESHWDDEAEFLIDFQNTDRYKMLLCHMPLCWVDSFSLYDYYIDTVFAGHVHGGQIRIPLIGGLWAPDQGWFPGQVCGVYTSTREKWMQSRAELLEFANNQEYDTSYYEVHDTYEPSALVLSRGLGNTDWVPRFNNIPEIVVVDLIPES